MRSSLNEIPEVALVFKLSVRMGICLPHQAPKWGPIAGRRYKCPGGDGHLPHGPPQLGGKIS